MQARLLTLGCLSRSSSEAKLGPQVQGWPPLATVKVGLPCGGYTHSTLMLEMALKDGQPLRVSIVLSLLPSNITILKCLWQGCLPERPLPHRPLPPYRVHPGLRASVAASLEQTNLLHVPDSSSWS